ncbi:hypothetical protein BCR37DRAFT_397553 [Protomyces lactucae-debilis]|uniref:Apple domain-containing protein n=1 Tax=Protomyces lactucae-debilis TaxID=2754530 RepID=A0A1Y2FM38_PROLT|nr:uncharacterized protein BCR37DRAFT_397553 [Protomyces lactucae-debilis]ORY85042.1 hypothetical protein BCR37DRAFT_397553 [Protomyces lactucae-debilis]
MTFTLTLLSLLLLVMHPEQQHAAAKAGRSQGQNFIRGQGEAVDSQSNKRGREEGQTANVGSSSSATISTDISPAVEGRDYFPRAEKGKCYNATFSIEHIRAFYGDRALCVLNKSARQSHIEDVCDTWCRKEEENYGRSQSRFNSENTAKNRCIQSLNINITRKAVYFDSLQSCDFECTCTLFKYVERIKMPHVQYKNQHFELSPFKPKSYWAKKAKTDTLYTTGFGQPTEQCLAPAGHGNTNADHAAHADASTSGQAALAGNIAESFTSDQEMTSLELMEWLEDLYDVEQSLQTGLPVDRNILTLQSCNIPDLDNLPGSNQPSEEVCVAPTHAVQRQEGQEQERNDNQGADTADQGKAVLPARSFI